MNMRKTWKLELDIYLWSQTFVVGCDDSFVLKHAWELCLNLS